MQILTVTANPAIDKTTVLPCLAPGSMHRPEKVIALPGGKGINVARAYRILGGQAEVAVLLGGFHGQWVEQALLAEGIPAHIAWFSGETRTCWSLLDQSSGLVTQLNENNATVSPQEWDAFEAIIVAAAQGKAAVVISGSLARGAPQDGYARLVRRIQALAAPVYLDAYGKPLEAALEACPHILKINAQEAAECLGQPVGTLQQAAAAAQQFSRLGVGMALVTLGEQGAAACNNGETWLAVPPKVDAVSSVGSGDALLAGLAWGLASGIGFPEALRLAAACGAANALSPGAGCFSMADVDRIAPQIIVKPANHS